MTPHELRTRLGELDAVVQQEQVALEHQSQRLAISRQLNALVYPVLTLPPEITSMIFLRFVVSASYCGSMYRRYTAPLIFLHVCTMWRDIASADSSLWAAMYFDFDTDYHRDAPATELQTFLESWALRAQSRPLSVDFCGDMVSRLGAARSAALMMRLAPKCYRGSSYIPDEHGPNYAFALAPGLRKIHLHRTSGLAVVAWKQLTVFYGDACSLQECTELLREAENLVECGLCIFGDNDGDFQPPRALTHMFLRNLTLFAPQEGVHIVVALLPLLTLPALHTFTLPDHKYDDNDADSFVDFLQRHSSHLVEMAVGRISPRILAPLSALAALQVWDVDPSFAYNFAALLEDPGVCFLPSLQHITWELEYPSSRRPRLQHADYEQLAQAISCRWRRNRAGGVSADVTGIRSLTLQVVLDPTETLADFHSLVDLGEKEIGLCVELIVKRSAQ
ncbi:hypothetical protein B0H16DRAFT_1458419 [Mycena metata]|uniref:F-box domain-containing protein n=1 Tax=Mycena metata TaxID=1033252 RepID=A0AAD7J308_9AGAR|nr:hypothetical protein B0H16DRAFT_1458419 [Mycena metata]